MHVDWFRSTDCLQRRGGRRQTASQTERERDRQTEEGRTQTEEEQTERQIDRRADNRKTRKHIDMLRGAPSKEAGLASAGLAGDWVWWVWGGGGTVRGVQLAFLPRVTPRRICLFFLRIVSCRKRNKDVLEFFMFFPTLQIGVVGKM